MGLHHRAFLASFCLWDNSFLQHAKFIANCAAFYIRVFLNVAIGFRGWRQMWQRFPVWNHQFPSIWSAFALEKYQKSGLTRLVCCLTAKRFCSFKRFTTSQSYFYLGATYPRNQQLTYINFILLIMHYSAKKTAIQSATRNNSCKVKILLQRSNARSSKFWNFLSSTFNRPHAALAVLSLSFDNAHYRQQWPCFLTCLEAKQPWENLLM